MKRLALGIVLLSVTSFSFSASMYYSLFHFCNSNTLESIGIVRNLDPYEMTKNWFDEIVANGGCSGTSYCDVYVPDEVAGPIVNSDPHGSFDYSFHHWEW